MSWFKNKWHVHIVKEQEPIILMMLSNANNVMEREEWREELILGVDTTICSLKLVLDAKEKDKWLEKFVMSAENKKSFKV